MKVRRVENVGEPEVFAFSVSDTGIGIPQGKWKFVFEPFTQVDASTKRKYGGTGLGLSISRGLAESMGGTLRLLSSRPEGSEFELQLPLQRASVTQPRPEPAKAARAAGRRFPEAALPIRKFKYGCRVCPDMPHYGHLSGCTYEEGKSWRKFHHDGMFAEIQADSTQVWPFLVKYLMEIKK